jgi:lipopolysaccharide/colanic/teichoic acid biosynthesis glycosyltransferase
VILQSAKVGKKSRNGQIQWGCATRRTLDIVVSAIALLMLSPTMLLIALAICVEDGLPIFFYQKRSGQNGRPFCLYKFRKFGVHQDTHGLPVTLQNDPRLTVVGGFLEKAKLDELPQFWNVLTGTMALVGPRPESLNFSDCFQGAYRQVLDHRPGIFGPAQTEYRNEAAYYEATASPERIYREVLFPAKASLDLAYYPTRTLLKDVGWILLGVLAVVRGHSHVRCSHH